jgi:hypothetical protein
MSVKQIEAAVQRLTEAELAEFRDWFRSFDGRAEGSEQSELPAAIRDELHERLDKLDADPSLSVPWEGTMSAVKRIRENILAQNASDRRI